MKHMVYPWNREPTKWTGNEFDHVITMPTAIGVEHDWQLTSREAFTEIVDVSVDCPKAITRVELRLYDFGRDRAVGYDFGRDRAVGYLTGPWLFRREVALVDLLAIVYDNVENKRQGALETMRDALEASCGLKQSIVLEPMSGLKINASFYSDGHDMAKIYFRTIQWRQLR